MIIEKLRLIFLITNASYHVDARPNFHVPALSNPLEPVQRNSWSKYSHCWFIRSAAVRDATFLGHLGNDSGYGSRCHAGSPAW